MHKWSKCIEKKVPEFPQENASENPDMFISPSRDCDVPVGSSGLYLLPGTPTGK